MFSYYTAASKQSSLTAPWCKAVKLHGWLNHNHIPTNTLLVCQIWDISNHLRNFVEYAFKLLGLWSFFCWSNPRLAQSVVPWLVSLQPREPSLRLRRLYFHAVPGSPRWFPLANFDAYWGSVNLVPPKSTQTASHTKTSLESRKKKWLNAPTLSKNVKNTS